MRKAIVDNYINEMQITILCDELGWNKDWILTGKGEEFINMDKSKPSVKSKMQADENDPVFDLFALKLLKNKTFVMGIELVVKSVLVKEKQDYTPEEYKSLLEKMLREAEEEIKKKQK